MYKIITYYEEDPIAIVDYRMKSKYYWDEHINYTRNAIISILADLSDIDDVVDRLMRNQEDIGSLLRPFYSTEVVDEFVKLLKEHVIVAGDLIKATRKGDDLTSLKASWDSNAADIVAFMSGVNSVNWPKALIAQVWNKHRETTLAEATARSEKNWVDDIAAYDANHECISEMAEIFASGVVSQNLESFCK
jgi:hypothetical protein